MGKRTKEDQMPDGTFAELKESAEQALAYERGAREGYRVTQAQSNKSSTKISAAKAKSAKSRLRAYRKNKDSSDK